VVVLVRQDQYLLEEGLIEQASDVFRGADIGGVAIGREVKRQPEVPLDGFPLGIGRVELGGDAGERLADAILFLAEQVDRDRSGVVGFHELAAFARELFLSLLELGSSNLDVPAGVREFGAHHGFDVVAEHGIELDALVEVFDLAFNLVDQH